MTETPIAGTIRRKLTARFAPATLDIVDESHLHVGHAGHDGRGESHFRVVIVSEAFSGHGRVARHRLVNAALAEELRGRVHALSVTARTPAEASRHSPESGA